MSDYAELLHNMSAPSKTVVKYAGLSVLTKPIQSSGGSLGGLSDAHDGVFGSFIAFRLPPELQSRSVASLLKLLGKKPGRNQDQTLIQLIERRAKELPIPDGCVVKPCKEQHFCPWPDPLAALVIITKSSANVWLRGKTPRLSAIGKRTEVSLLLPPEFAARLKEVTK